MTTPLEPLVIEPQEIFFDPDYDVAQRKLITFTSQSLQMKTVFKIKLTHRDMYTVDPPNGFIKPGEKITVDLVLQPCEWSPEVAEKNKMLIQTLQVLPEDRNAVQDLFLMGVPPMDQKAY
ncbi:unnamed protein product [Soboliphyme baturini]|uniref:MSP domain-containing protein n=1 Tax=Soboliphyme baturini TaxID=241478 RepID=A0A183IKN1_9BILA|nr:unnamed protein product [Soboliphyme baturini]